MSTIRTTVLLGSALLLAPRSTPAQYVQVPTGTGCTVVVAGTGGNTALNRVGHGGIVRMLDGFDTPGAGGDFNWVGGTVHAWGLLGDLSFQTDFSQAAPVPGANPPLQTAGPVFTVNIQSYNKNLRAIELSAAAKGRSKGRVSVRYKAAPCDSTLSFEVFKEWVSGPPPIAGPSCWPTILQTVSFSVDPLISDNAADLIGFDPYYWKFTNGGGIDLFASLTSAYTFTPDRSAISVYMGDPAFTAWYTGGPYTVQCCYGRANAWDGGAGPLLGRLSAGTTCMSKAVGLPAAPTYTGGFPLCVNAVSPGLPITVLSSNYNSAYTYSWTRSNLSWTFTTPNLGGITINSIGNGDPCTFILVCTPVNPNVGCAATFTYLVNRNYNNAAMLASPSPYCTSTGLFTVSLGTTYQGNQTCWGALPALWTATNVGSSGVQFNIPAAAAGTTNTINLFSCGQCSSVLLPIVINVRPAAPVFSPAPTTCVTLNTAYTYTLVNPGPFTWTHTNWTGPTTGNPVSLTPTTAPLGNIIVTRDGLPGCPSLPATVVPYVAPTLPATAVVQPCYNLGVPAITGNATFTIVPAVFAANGAGTYLWTFPPLSFFNTTAVPIQTSVIATTSAASNIQVSRPTTGIPGNYTFTVRFTPAAPSTCPFVETTINTINTNLGNVAYTWSNAPSPPVPGTVGQLQAPPFAPVGTTYQAYDCNVPIGVFGLVYNSATVPLNTYTVAANSLTVNMVVPQAAGVVAPAPLTCTWRPACLATNHRSMVLAGENGEPIELRDGASDVGFQVMPNPNDGTFTLNISRSFTNGRMVLVDNAGVQVGSSIRVAQGANAIGYDHLAPGVYSVRVELDGEAEVQRIVVFDMQ